VCGDERERALTLVEGSPQTGGSVWPNGRQEDEQVCLLSLFVHLSASL